MEILPIEEANMLARDYSIVRNPGKKWRSFVREEETTEAVRLDRETFGNFILVSRVKGVVEGYSKSVLYKRVVLRRNFAILKVAQGLWELINPFKLVGISKKVYGCLYNTIYKIALRDSYEEKSVEKYISTDERVDFNGKTWLGFADFYDGLFEFIDSYTKNIASIEYIYMLKVITSAVSDMKWSLGLNLYSKLHIPNDCKSVYHAWMVSLLKSQKLQKKDEVPSLIKLPNEIKVSERLLIRKPLKPVDRENFNLRKLEQMMSVQLMKEFKHGNRCATQGQTRGKVFEKKPSTYYISHLDKISPLSCLIKSSRSRPSILEKVIDGRKSLNFKSLTQRDLLL